MGGMSIGNLPNQSILKKINDIAADVNDLDLEGVNNLKSKLSELVAPELGNSDTKAISQKVVTENIERLNTEVNNKINKVESAQNGNLPSFDNGHIKDSKIPASNIAQANGYYESMIVGASRNLAGNNIVTAKYTYRPTADTTDVADGVAKISSVKGNTIVWNQKVATKIIECNGNANFIAIDNIPQGHKVIFSIENMIDNQTELLITLANNKSDYELTNYINIPKNTIEKKSKLILLEEEKNYIYIYSYSEKYDKKFDNVQLFDLTQMFGEGNEPTIEEFEAMFPNDYYEYNEGELRSIEDFQIKSVGFNQWDEEWELGNGTGGDIDYSSKRYVVSTNYVKVIPNATYYIKAPFNLYLYGYNANKIIISNTHFALVNKLFTIPNDVHYLKFQIAPSYGTTYKNDISINLSHSGIRDGEYEPYQEDILPINISIIKDENGEQLFPNGLCSAGEAHDELVYDKGIGKWKAVKRIGSVDMGSLKWSKYEINDSKYVFSLSRPSYIKTFQSTEKANVLTIKYPTVKWNELFGDVVNYGFAVSGEFLRLGDNSFTDVIALRESLQGQILYYELATPIEVVLDDFTSNYKVSDWGTEEILMNSTPIVPVIYDVEYALNAVDTLRNMPTNYISKESLDAFLSALGGAMGGTWKAIWNEDMQKYTFNFTPNAVNVE